MANLPRKRPLNIDFFSQGNGSGQILDAFQHQSDDSAKIGTTSWMHGLRRPLPSSNALTVAAVDDAASAAKPPCPLIQDFLKSVGKAHLITAINRQDQGLDGGDATEKSTTTVTKPNHHNNDGQAPLPLGNTTFTTMSESPVVSKLTAGQHRRFLVLSRDHDTTIATAPRTLQTNKEYRRLKNLVQEEQQLYGEALLQFWLSNVDRLQVGLSEQTPEPEESGQDQRLSYFARLAMRDVLVERWKQRELPLQYGKCRQVISLRLAPKSTVENTLKQRDTILDSLQHEVVFQSAPSNRKMAHLPPVGTVIGATKSSSPKDAMDVDSDATISSTISFALPIQQDKRAIDLARKHGATMITTCDTLLVLLRTCISSTAPAASWTIPVSRRGDKGKGSINKDNDLIILESPSQLSFSSTREWMTAGAEEGLNQWLEEQSSTTSEADTTSNIDDGSSCYTYTLLTFPSPVLRSKPCRILARQRDRFFCSSGKCPLRTHVHLEYFPERGREIPSIFDKAVWMLDYVLQPLCRVVVAKVDPASCRILEWEDVSLAHALTLPSSLPKPLIPMSDKNINSSMDHLWRQLSHLLTMAIPTIGPGQHVLCYPARFGKALTQHDEDNTRPRHHSISVHQPQVQASSEEVLVDVAVEISQAKLMDEQLKRLVDEPDALRRCYRPWRWEVTSTENAENQQVPYTFPVAAQSKVAAAARHKE